MKNKFKRPVAILFVICLSLLAGLLVDVGWDTLDRITHPVTYREWIEQYGEEYGVTVTSAYMQGTMVKIVIPARKEV